MMITNKFDVIWRKIVDDDDLPSDIFDYIHFFDFYYRITFTTDNFIRRIS